MQKHSTTIVMNLNSLLKKYFTEDIEHHRIEMFDKDNIYAVFQSSIDHLMKFAEINLSVLQGLGYCLYEILDNVITHSEKKCGILIHSFDSEKSTIKILVADDGIGIWKSLTRNPEYIDVSEKDALSICINNSVTDGHGMGFGLYSMSRLIKSAGLNMSIHSGSSMLRYKSNEFVVEETDNWEGTIVWLELHSDVDIDANNVVENRTDAAGEFNDAFINDDNQLW